MKTFLKNKFNSGLHLNSGFLNILSFHFKKDEMLGKVNARNIRNYSNFNTNNQNQKNNNKFWIIINILFGLSLIILTWGIDPFLVIISQLTWTKVITAYLAITLILIIYNLLDILLLISLNKGKIKIPKYLPSSIYNWLKLQEYLSEDDSIRMFIDLRYKAIIAHILGIISAIIIYFIKT